MLSLLFRRFSLSAMMPIRTRRDVPFWPTSRETGMSVVYMGHI